MAEFRRAQQRSLSELRLSGVDCWRCPTRSFYRGHPECSEVTDVAAGSVELHPIVLASLPKTGIHKDCLAKDAEQETTDLPQQPRAGTLNMGGEAAP